MLRRRRTGGGLTWMALVAAIAAAGLGTYKLFNGKAVKPGYVFTSVDRGDILLQVAASGTLAAVTTVQVGTQVSGTIAELYADYNAEVKRGQLLARLDPALFKAQVEQQEANVRTAEANLTSDSAAIASAKANLEKARVDLLDKQRKLERNRNLFNATLVSRDDLDTAQAAHEAALATADAAEAQVESAKSGKAADEARLNQARASLESARLNLANTVITSPISGTIISRNVDKGQTVAASFSSPTLFQIGEDLTKMQVNANIDEADVARIRKGMHATFTVDAYPEQVFAGTLSQIRLAASTVQNVVTYNAIIDVANPQLRLKPGMTATVKILVQRVEDVLRLPNTALRFRPSLSDQEMEAAYERAGERKYHDLVNATAGAASTIGENRGSLLPAALSRIGSPTGAGLVAYAASLDSRPAGVAANVEARKTVWILDADNLLLPVTVMLGITDGVYTQVINGKLSESSRIITGLVADPNATAKNAITTGAPGFGPGMGGGPPPPPR